MEDKTLEMTMLLDFFGELLTQRQRSCLELHYGEDLSLGEIASELGISRQGVRDNLVRAEKSLREYEARTGIVRRFVELQSALAKAAAQADRLLSLLPEGEERAAAEELRRQIGELKG